MAIGRMSRRRVAVPHVVVLRGGIARLRKRLAQRLSAWEQRIPERWWLLIHVARWLWSPAYAAARQSVRKVAIDPSFAGKRGTLAFQYMRNESGLYHPLGENLIREVEARQWARLYAKDAGVSVSWQMAGALCELAYHAVKSRGPQARG